MILQYYEDGRQATGDLEWVSMSFDKALKSGEGHWKGISIRSISCRPWTTRETQRLPTIRASTTAPTKTRR